MGENKPFKKHKDFRSRTRNRLKINNSKYNKKVIVVFEQNELLLFYISKILQKLYNYITFILQIKKLLQNKNSYIIIQTDIIENKKIHKKNERRKTYEFKTK